MMNKIFTLYQIPTIAPCKKPRKAPDLWDFSQIFCLGFHKGLVLLLAVVLILVPLSGCSDGAGATVRYDLTREPESLDPQFATGEEAKLVLRNSMEGLFLPDGAGGTKNGACQSYEISSDGLVWTFTLKENLVWAGEETMPITAADFAFALTRLFTQDYKSPFAGEFIMIKNASEILAGTLSPDTLGVRAIDSGTLEITLAHETPYLPEVLATTAAMPCNEAFYRESRGRYGLTSDMLLYNGPFTVYYWEREEKDRYIQLRKNASYHTPENVLPARVTLYVKPSDQRFSRFKDQKTDGAVLSLSEVQKLSNKKISTVQFEDTVWVLLLNQSDPFLKTPEVRRALLQSVDHRAFAHLLDEDLVYSSVFCPPTLELYGESYRSQSGFERPDFYDKVAARASYKAVRESVERPEVLNILCPELSSHPLVAAAIQKNWRDTLGLPVNLVQQPTEDVLAAVETGEYTVALVPLQPKSIDPISFLGQFRSDFSGNLVNYQNPAYDALLAAASTEQDEREGVQLLWQAEEMLYTDGVLLPLYFQTHYYAMTKGVSGILFSPFGGDTYFVGAMK